MIKPIKPHYDISDYEQFVFDRIKDPNILVQEASASTLNAWHMATGISGEAGEILEIIKKWAVYGKKFDRADLIKELGDIEFYLEGLRQHFHIDREEVIMANIEKLAKRYVEKYSDQQAIERKDV
jgi:NTP pyrophosphatase (non-canonical NTP hydrolase)